MLKLNRVLLTPDDNTASTSSTEADVKVADSSSAEQAATETVEEGAEASEATESTESATEETAEETAEEQTEEETEQQEAEVPEAEKVVDKTGDEKLPFNTHPRFKELVQEKNTAREELAAAKPLVEQARVLNDFMRDNQIQPQEFQSTLQYLRLLRTDPSAAFAMLKPTYEQLSSLVGERLPADLQEEVAAGALAPERATEIAKARAATNYQKWQQSNQQQRGQMQSVEAVSGTIQNWVATKQTIDPDFKSGSPLWEQVDLRIKAMPAFQTPQEAQSGTEKAYTEAKAFLQRFAPRPAASTVKRPPTSRNTSSNNQTVIKTPEDVMKAIAAGVRPSQMRYS